MKLQIFALLFLLTSGLFAEKPSTSSPALPEKLIGYWGISEKGAYNMLMHRYKGRVVEDKEKALIQQQAKGISKMMVFHFKDLEHCYQYTKSGQRDSKWKAAEVRNDLNEIDIVFLSTDKGEEKGTIYIEDKLFAFVKKGSKRQMPLVHNAYTFVKIEENEAKDRIKVILAKP